MTRYTHPEMEGSLHPDSAFVLDVVQYPSGWLRTASTSEIEALGFEVDETPAQISPHMIARERDRRLSGGFDYDFGDIRGVHRIGTTPKDMSGWDEVTKLAAACLATGNNDAPILVSTDTGAVSVTALEWQEILLAAAAFRQPVWQASFVLSAMSPIPADYADDGYWP